MTSTLTESRLRTARPPVENCVGVFACFTYDCAESNELQTLVPHRETFDTSTWIVSEVGKFLSKDPIGISGGLNQYVFVGNDPVNYVDPWGLDRYRLVTGLPFPGIAGHTVVEIERDGRIHSYDLTGYSDTLSGSLTQAAAALTGQSVPGQWNRNASDPFGIPGRWRDVDECEGKKLFDGFETLADSDVFYNLYTGNSHQSPRRIIDAILNDGLVIGQSVIENGN